MNATIELLKVKSALVLKTDHKTIQENDVLEILGNEFPLINETLDNKTTQTSIYKTINCFSDYTKQLIKKGNLSEVKHCFNVAEKMLLEGNKAVKIAIENVYIFSMSSVFDLANPLSYKLKGMMNKALLTEYKRQVCASGI